MSHNIYQDPWTARYATKDMLYAFSDEKKIKIWRELWIALAESEMELGLPITKEQVSELKEKKDEINFDIAAEYEKKFRHDVMAHVHTYGDVCPSARGIIHLGATSCFIGDNSDIIIMRDALNLVLKKLVAVINELATFAEKYKDTICLGYTHFQPSQPTTVGKRACLWLYDLVMDLEDLELLRDSIKLRGVKGTTGTQASFLKLFDGNHKKVKKLEELVTKKMGFKGFYAVTGQTYSRKIDAKILFLLSQIAASASKFSNDLRLLQNFRELKEPFGSAQIASSAMPYKRNPMRSERITSLARFVINLTTNASFTHANQWLERTLDDSANKRLSISQAFLGVDSILNLFLDVVKGLEINEDTIKARLNRELPFMLSENILMEAVKAGGDRQKLHEKIREHAQRSIKNMDRGKENNLLALIAQDEHFASVASRISEIERESKLSGRSKEQTEEFLDRQVKPILVKYKDYLGEEPCVKV